VTSTGQRSHQERIALLCGEGNRHAAAGEYSEALACFIEAFELLPEPAEGQVEYGLVMAGLNRVLRARRDLAPGLEALLSRGRSFTSTRARGGSGS
jgi:Flp pilus assembly protein TadD